MDLGIDPILVLRLNRLQKIGVGAGLGVALGIGYWWFFFSDRMAEIERLQSESVTLEQQIQAKQKQLAELPKLQAKLAEVEKKELETRKQLPATKDIPSLLSDISLTGHQEGLSFDLFDPGAEKEEDDFYASVPIQLKITGNFTSIGHFLENVANFFRIVDIAKIDIIKEEKKGDTKAAKNESSKVGGDNLELTVAAKAVTYVFREGKDDAQKSPSSKKK